MSTTILTHLATANASDLAFNVDIVFVLLLLLLLLLLFNGASPAGTGSRQVAQTCRQNIGY